MRTISATVSTREEAESAARRLEALGVERERILFKEVGEPEAGTIFMTVKVAPGHVEAATDILKTGSEADRPVPAPQRSGETRTVSAAPTLPPSIGSTTARPAQVAEPSGHGRDAQSHAGAAKDRQPSSVRLARMAAIAALLAGLGFAVGAALGTLA
ncbi:MAG TPA: hypothetical protein VF582_01340 [Allosphingosinicella sp.]|jgi:hypothetical protein